MARHAVSMRRNAIVHGQLRSGRDRSAGINLNPALVDPQVAVGHATVIQIFETISSGTIQGETTGQFDQINLREIFNGATRLGKLHKRPGKLADLSASHEINGSEQTAAVDSAASDLHLPCPSQVAVVHPLTDSVPIAIASGAATASGT